MARAALRWPADRPILLAIRRLIARVGLDRLVAAMKIVKQAVPDVLLFIAGRGPLEAALRRQIAEAGLERGERWSFAPDSKLLVTGGTKGVGRGIAQRLADAGATIAVCSRSEPETLPSGWEWFGVDLRDGDAAWAMVDQVVERIGRLDVLVNNAGGAPPADSTTAKPRFTERIIALNLFAAIFCSQRANHWMQQQDTGGSIVNIGSVSGQRPTPQTAAYGAAKAGLVNFTQTTAVEWAPKVRVNHITAGMVRTEQSHLFYGDEAGIAQVGLTVPLGRIANP